MFRRDPGGESPCRDGPLLRSQCPLLLREGHLPQPRWPRSSLVASSAAEAGEKGAATAAPAGTGTGFTRTSAAAVSPRRRLVRAAASPPALAATSSSTARPPGAGVAARSARRAVSPRRRSAASAPAVRRDGTARRRDGGRLAVCRGLGLAVCGWSTPSRGRSTTCAASAGARRCTTSGDPPSAEGRRGNPADIIAAWACRRAHGAWIC